MSPYKRKWDELDGSDDEEPSLGKQILPVANLPENFNEAPTDGMQYLFTVRRDARSLPHSTRVANPYERPEPSLPQRDDSTSTHPALPSEEWRASFKIHFRNFRKNFAQPTIHVHFNPQNQLHKLMPDMRERDLWWAFLAGRPESEWNPPTKPKPNSRKKHKLNRGMRGFADEPDFDTPVAAPQIWHINDEGGVELTSRSDPCESLPTPTGTPAPQEHNSEEKTPTDMSVDQQESFTWKPREPTPSVVQHIDQRMSLHLLMYFTHWINRRPPSSNSQLTESHARWIFVLLSRIEDHISANDMSQLRNLSRACLGLLKASILQRSASAKSEEPPIIENSGEVKRSQIMTERSCWIIISAIVDVWGQRDLWMDAEAMLTSLDSCL